MSKDLKVKTIFGVSPECQIASREFTKKDWKSLVKANEEISKRQTYGIRREKAETRGTVATWSNGAKSWLCGYEPVEAGKELTLDANQVFLPISPERCRRIQSCMIDLPLYYFSTQAWTRGEISPSEAGKQWALRQLEKILREAKSTY